MPLVLAPVIEKAISPSGTFAVNQWTMHMRAYFWIHFFCLYVYLFSGLLNIPGDQFRCSVMSDSLWPHGLQHARPPCPSPTPGACSNSCPSRQWCHPTIASSVVPFSSHLQSFPGKTFQWVFSNESALRITWPKWRYHVKKNVSLWLLTTEPAFLGNPVQALLRVGSGEAHTGVQGCPLKVSRLFFPCPHLFPRPRVHTGTAV